MNIVAQVVNGEIMDDGTGYDMVQFGNGEMILKLKLINYTAKVHPPGHSAPRAPRGAIYLHLQLHLHLPAGELRVPSEAAQG